MVVPQPEYPNDFCYLVRLEPDRGQKMEFGRRAKRLISTSFCRIISYLRRPAAAGFSASRTARTGFGLTSTNSEEYQFSFVTVILIGNVWGT